MRVAPDRTPGIMGGSERASMFAWYLMFRESWGARELVWRLLTRNLAAQVRQSFLGWAWIALPPIATALVFTLLRQADIVNVPMSGHLMPYTIFALVGTTIWQFFTQVTMAATNSMANAGSLVSKVYFPREVLVFSAAGIAWLNLLVRVVVIALSCAALDFRPHFSVLLFPVVLLPVFFLGLGLGMLLAPVNTMMTDTSRLLEFAFQFGIFLAPTVYPTPVLAQATTRWAQALYWLHTLNPVTHFIHAVDSLLEFGYCTLDAGFWAATLLSGLVFLVGWRFFHLCEPLLAERL